MYPTVIMNLPSLRMMWLASLLMLVLHLIPVIRLTNPLMSPAMIMMMIPTVSTALIYQSTSLWTLFAFHVCIITLISRKFATWEQQPSFVGAKFTRRLVTTNGVLRIKLACLKGNLTLVRHGHVPSRIRRQGEVTASLNVVIWKQKYRHFKSIHQKIICLTGQIHTLFDMWLSQVCQKNGRVICSENWLRE